MEVVVYLVVTVMTDSFFWHESIPVHSIDPVRLLRERTLVSFEKSVVILFVVDIAEHISYSINFLIKSKD